MYIIYQDEIRIYAQTLKIYLNLLKKIFYKTGQKFLKKSCKSAIVKCKACHWKNRILADPEKFIAIIIIKLPKNISKLNGSIGFTSYFTYLIEGIGKIAKILTRILEANKLFY